ncbi:hypothetical protein ACI3PL_25835, partial [Lacticaseibacillus paracasei]
VIKVDLPEKAMLSYMNMELKLITEVESGKVVAKTAGVSLGKCRQMASGAVFLTPEVTALLKPQKAKKDWVEIHDVKIEALLDLVE